MFWSLALAATITAIKASCADIGAVSDMSYSLRICGEIIDGPPPWQYGTGVRQTWGFGGA
jgi:hypothetical protein